MTDRLYILAMIALVCRVLAVVVPMPLAVAGTPGLLWLQGELR